MYYICLKKLFNFSFIDKNQRFCSIKSNEQITESLKEHNFFSFHHRLVVRMMLFLHKILFLNNSPKQLKAWLPINNDQRLGVSLRSNDKKHFIIEKTFTKFGDLTFSNVFTRFLNSINFNDFDACLCKFKSARLLNKTFYSDLNSLFKLFPKFNCDLNFYFMFI